MGAAKKNGHTTEEEDKFLGVAGQKTEENSKIKNDGFLRKLKLDTEFRHRFIHTSVVWWSFITLVCYIQFFKGIHLD